MCVSGEFTKGLGYALSIESDYNLNYKWSFKDYKDKSLYLEVNKGKVLTRSIAIEINSERLRVEALLPALKSEVMLERNFSDNSGNKEEAALSIKAYCDSLLSLPIGSQEFGFILKSLILEVHRASVYKVLEDYDAFESVLIKDRSNRIDEVRVPSIQKPDIPSGKVKSEVSCVDGEKLRVVLPKGLYTRDFYLYVTKKEIRLFDSLEGCVYSCLVDHKSLFNAYVVQKNIDSLLQQRWETWHFDAALLNIVRFIEGASGEKILVSDLAKISYSDKNTLISKRFYAEVLKNPYGHEVILRKIGIPNYQVSISRHSDKMDNAFEFEVDLQSLNGLFVKSLYKDRFSYLSLNHLRSLVMMVLADIVDGCKMFKDDDVEDLFKVLGMVAIGDPDILNS